MLNDRNASGINRIWCVRPDDLRAAHDAVAGKEMAQDETAELRTFEVTSAGAAIIPITGLMTKGESIFSLFGVGTNTLRTRQQIRAAVADEGVKSIMLFVDSGGGEVAGTDELAEDIRAANRVKPTFAFIEDLGASAALWVASQAGAVFTNRMGEVGSIGVFTVLVDASEMAAAEGLTVHVISTGDFKGSALGAPVTEAQLQDVQRMVDAINVEFKAAIKRGTGMKAAAIDKIADGRVFIGSEALGLGLVDGVRSFEGALGELEKEIRARRRGSRAKATAARIEIEKRR
jgi:signal peptide peptidase SppA